MYAQLVKTGMPPQDHVDARLDLIGMESLVSAVSVEDNGMLHQSCALAPTETGMDSHVLPVPLDKHGTQSAYHAHAQQIQTGTVLNAKLALVPESGASKSMIVSAEQETGTEPHVSSAHQTQTGTERLVLHVMEVEFGTLWIWFVNAQSKLNGTELYVLKHAQAERSS